MSRTRASRPIPLALTALVALFSALVALAISGGGDAAAHSDASHQGTLQSTTAAPAAATISKKEFALRQEMRRLWEDHITWTRLAIISLTTGSPDTEATVGRLLKNQTDIGNAVKPFYGEAAGTKLTGLLREHILTAHVSLDLLDDGEQLPRLQAGARTADRVVEILLVLRADRIGFVERGDRLY